MEKISSDKSGILYAVVRVRGGIDVKKEIKDTLTMLRLKRINHCVVVPKTPVFDGMIRKAKDYITWGEVDKKLLEKLKAKDKSEKPVFRLNPPKKGYESTKCAFPKGSLGYRGEKINDLIERMI